MSKNILGYAIRDLRKRKHLTQADLSKLTEFSQNTISNHENGIRMLDEKAIMTYAKALGVTPNYFFDHFESDASNYIEKINNLLHVLDDKRKSEVYNFTKVQLEEQNRVRKIVSIEPNPQVEETADDFLVAAHIDEDATEEELEKIRAFIEKVKKEHRDGK